jgi:GAF domain-containing protein
MSELQKQKLNILTQLKGLCAHCATDSGRSHNCPVQQISARIQSLRGVPLIVNNEFKGVLWPHI